MSAGTLYVGTSGWSYAHWAGGRFYPRGLKQGDWLVYYADRFSTVEINASFYRLPRPQMVERWRKVTKAGFRFAVKMWRRITHEKKLVDCERELADFLETVARLGPRRGPLLVQLPPSFRQDLDRLKHFFDLFRQVAGRSRWRLAFEFRHPSWIGEEVYRFLDRRRAAVCLADLPRCPITEPNDAPFVYVRRHGPQGRYRGGYPPRQITADARRVRSWLDAGRDVYVYYNNDIEGHAVRNAAQLRERVEP
ncbi:MAG: DUF72 domain-containing protein [Planctomycetota bacterium]|nr:MAG: DUF72 domain-containing protein [Planctomycetota bacterium]